MDGQPVDLVFLLLAPEGAGADHLKALARIARLLRDQDVAKKLRASRDAQAIYSVLALPPASCGVIFFVTISEFAKKYASLSSINRVQTRVSKILNPALLTPATTAVSERSPPATRCSMHSRSPLRGCRSA